MLTEPSCPTTSSWAYGNPVGFANVGSTHFRIAVSQIAYSAYLGLDPDDLVSDYEREAEAQTKAGRLAVGTAVVDRELVGRSDTFHVGTRVIFWTFVTGGRPAETIRHVWIHEGRTAGAVDLTVAGPSWRTQSRRTLVPGTEGEWVVEALDSEGRVLVRHEFRCEVQATFRIGLGLR